MIKKPHYISSQYKAADALYLYLKHLKHLETLETFIVTKIVYFTKIHLYLRSNINVDNN